MDLYNGSTQDISSAANAVVGQAIKKSGSTTKVTSGTVTAVNVTVNYGDGPVYNMVRTTACSVSGDSGGAHFATRRPRHPLRQLRLLGHLGLGHPPAGHRGAVGVRGDGVLSRTPYAVNRVRRRLSRPVPVRGEPCAETLKPHGFRTR